MRKFLLLPLLLIVCLGASAQKYHETDKEGLRKFLRQGHNLYGAQLSVNDTLNWYTSEAWVEKIKSNEIDNRLACTWEDGGIWGKPPYRLTQLNLGGYPALDWNFTGTLDCSYFPSLYALFIKDQYIEKIDLSKNRIQSIWIDSYLQPIDLIMPKSANNRKALVELRVSNAVIGKLDVSGCEDLKWLYCENSYLSELKLGNNYKLEQLSCGGNNIKSIDILELNPESLKYLSFDGTADFEWEYLQYFENLISLGFGNSKLTSFDFSKNIKLKKLAISSNPFTTLDVKNLPDLEELYCSSNKLTSLDLTGNPKLKKLYCGNNQISSLNLSNNRALEILDCPNNKNLSSLDLQYQGYITTVNAANCNLSYIDIISCQFLKKLDCSKNNLSMLDISNNAYLENVDCSYNKITGLFAPRNLSTLTCNNNQLTSLDISSISKDKITLNASNNNLTSILMSDGQTLYSCDLSQNNFMFSTLPVGVGQTWRQTIAPQKDINITMRYDGVISLGEYNIRGNISTYKWYDQAGNPATDPVNFGNGMFYISINSLGQTLTCKVTNPAYPSLTLNYKVTVTGNSRKAKQTEKSAIEQELSVNVYPNPVSDVLRIDTPNEVQSVTVYDLAGRTVKKAGNVTEIDVRDMQEGFYIIRVTTADGQVSQKFKKQ
ncbi:MAG: leucine-rich repeat domain-containing protein [Dysgonomonas sp.]